MVSWLEDRPALTDADFLASVLSDGKPHTTSEVIGLSFKERGCGITVHSRAADLRKKGFNIECRCEGRPGGRAVYSYQLASSAEPPLSNVREDGANRAHGDVGRGGSAGNAFAKRFWSKVERQTDDECWPWLAYCDRDGYGTIRAAGKHGAKLKAPRVAYELAKGPIPDGLHIDHLCRNPICVNPAHLEAVTPRENLMRGNNHVALNARKTHCMRGHEFDAENTYVSKEGERQCKECRRQRDRALAGYSPNGEQLALVPGYPRERFA